MNIKYVLLPFTYAVLRKLEKSMDKKNKNFMDKTFKNKLASR